MSPVSSEVLTKLTGKLRCDRVSVVWAWHPFQTQGVGRWMDIFTKFLWICDQIIKIYLSISSNFGICQNLIFVFSEALYRHLPPLQTQRVGCWMDILTKIFQICIQPGHQDLPFYWQQFWNLSKFNFRVFRGIVWVSPAPPPPLPFWKNLKHFELAPVPLWEWPWVPDYCSEDRPFNFN